MKKTLSKMLLLTVTLFGTAFCSSPSKAINIKTSSSEKKTFVENIELKTVALVKTVEDSIVPYCSGVWVGPREILTAFHCIQNEILGGTVQYKTLLDKKKESKAAEVIIFDFANDLALLRAEEKSIEPHPVAELSKESWDGQHVNIVGHTGGLWWSYIEGVVSSMRTKINTLGQEQLLLQVSAAVWFGNSGGGLWDDQGKLMGISSFIIPKAPMVSFFIHSKHIRNLIRSSIVLKQ